MGKIKQNTTDLDALIAKAEALPDAGAGGGSAVKTCTVTINNDYDAINDLYVTVLQDGVVSCIDVPFSSYESTTVENVIVGSMVAIGVTTLPEWSLDILSGDITVVYFGRFAGGCIVNGDGVIDVWA